MNETFFNDVDINNVIKEHLDAEMAFYGDWKYSYVILNKKEPSEIRIINNYPEWVKTYLDECYQFVDPVILKAMDSVQDFHWDENIIVFSEVKLRKIFTSSNNYNIITGHTFVLHDNKNNLAVLSVFGQGNIPEFLIFIERNKEIKKIFSIFL